MRLNVSVLKHVAVIGSVLAAILAISASAAGAYDSDWQSADGGIFNPPSEIFNTEFHGFGSTGQVIYNKIDLQNGKTMYVQDGTPMHDSDGNVTSTAIGSGVGYVDGEKGRRFDRWFAHAHGDRRPGRGRNVPLVGERP